MPKKTGSKAIDAVDETAVVAGSGRKRVTGCAEISSGVEMLPQRFDIGRLGEAAAHADDGDGLATTWERLRAFLCVPSGRQTAAGASAGSSTRVSVWAAACGKVCAM